MSIEYKRRSEASKQRTRDASRAWKRKNPERYLRQVRCATLRKKYNITADEYDELFAQQGGQCAICGTTKCSTGYHMAVDHNHVTGEIRGILCQSCNTALGHFKDDPALLDKAKEYLR